MGWLAWWDPAGCTVGRVFCPVGWTYWLTACWFWLVLCSFCWLCTIGGGGAAWNCNFNYIGLTQWLSVNSRKKRFVNPIKIEVTRRARTETILGKSPAIFNGHQPPRVLDPYRRVFPNCHTRLHLGFSAKLRTWQVPACKIEPWNGVIFCKNRARLPSLF